MDYEIIDGNRLCAETAYNFIDAAGIYPITPSSDMAEEICKKKVNGDKNFYGSKVLIKQMQSEAGAIAAVHGMLSNGVLASTFTSSQGLLLMIPNMYKIAGELLPCVINVASRTVATHALSIMGDHSDIYAARTTGFAILASSRVEDIDKMTSVAYLSAINGRVPFINFFDGFRTSHEYNKIKKLDMKKVSKLINKDKLIEFKNRSMDIDNPTTRGTNESDSIYFQSVESRNIFYENLEDIVNDEMSKINEIANTSYAPFNYYGSKKATKVIVAMGSVCSTIRNYIDFAEEDLGLIEVHLYRPFSKKYFLNVLPRNVRKIAVLDRAKEIGATGEPLYLDVTEIIKSENLNIDVVGGRYGLSGKDTSLEDIKAVYKYLDKAAKRKFTIGINDDITKLSLKKEKVSYDFNGTEMLIYGYGSDGMVTCSKDILNIVGKKDFVQGYFSYDSKKSGGLTISNLRFSKEKIDSPYYVKTPSIVVVSKDSYLKMYDVLEGIKENGTFILNTEYKKEDIGKILPKKIKDIIAKKNINFYIINASKIARDNNIALKISMIMEMAIFKVCNLYSYNKALNEVEKLIKNNFSKKGENIVNNNINAIKSVEKSIEKIDIKKIEETIEDYTLEESIYSYLKHNKGYDIPVSFFKNRENGTFEPGLSKLEKRKISTVAPSYNKEKCISCNLCSFVCPHAVINPYLLNEKEYNNAPLKIKERAKDIEIEGVKYKFIVASSKEDCTGCNLCVNICPTKALTMEKILDYEEEEFKYLENLKEKNLNLAKTVKSLGFIKPKFLYSGACMGCGETPYLNLLTKLFKDNIMIANATGCSSIYGASIPNTPYLVPWANSLFEDNAEFAYGIRLSEDAMHEKVIELMHKDYNKLNKHNKELVNLYLEDYSSDISKHVYDNLDYNNFKSIIPYKKYIKEKSIWAVGGDGWAYDIGFSGIDHILSSNENINILVLDTEVYSNTGGQASKASRLGSINKFSEEGKTTSKKDLAKIATCYPNCYVATISLGGNYMQAIKALEEANNHDGPSIVIAYAPCIAHGIKNGMEDAIKEEKLAVVSGYFPLFRYTKETGLILDSEADFSKYEEIFKNENRYNCNNKELLNKNKKDSEERYNELTK